MLISNRSFNDIRSVTGSDSDLTVHNQASCKCHHTCVSTISIYQPHLLQITDLVSPTYKVKIMSIQELAHYVSTKCKRDSTIIFAPALHVFVRVRPQQIAQQAWK